MIWHVIIDGEQRGPLSRAQVLEYLHDGQLVRNDQIWRPGFSDWKSIGELAEFWQPPKRGSSPPPLPPPISTELAERDDTQTAAVVADRKWSLWGAANIGLVLSVLVLLIQIANGQGFELANYAMSANAETVLYLAGRLIAAPLIFVIVAMIVNAFRRLPKSDASAIKGATVFAMSFVGIGVLLALYGQWFFSSTEPISGATRDFTMKTMQPACDKRQMSLRQGQNPSDEQISKYCQCFSIKMADNTTYKGLTRDADAPDVRAYLKQQAEAAGRECRTWVGP